MAELISAQDSSYWREAFRGQDVCCSLVLTLEEALADPHWAARGLFDSPLDIAGDRIPALPSIIAPSLRDAAVTPRAPALGAENAQFIGKQS